MQVSNEGSISAQAAGGRALQPQVGAKTSSEAYALIAQGLIQVA